MIQNRFWNFMNAQLTPREIVKELDKYIIAQQDAKRAIAIAMCNRLRRQRVSDDLRGEIMPNNIILIGPTGVGKTELARRLARITASPFIKVEATKFTEVGYVGRDVESIVRDLVDISVNIVRNERIEQVEAKAYELARERLLDLLLPKPDNSKKQSDTPAKPQNRSSRQKLAARLEKGELDSRMIEIDVPEDVGSLMQVFSSTGVEEMGINIQEMFAPMLPKKSKKRRMSVSDALVYLTQEETEKLIDFDDVVREAIDRAEETGIVFLDEIDKVAANGQGSGPDVSRQGVQRDILPIVEGTAVQSKYGMVRTDHILFIAAGAFHHSKPSDLIPEIQGRFPVRVEMDSLTTTDFERILVEPKNSLIKQYKALVATENVQLNFTKGAIREIAFRASEVNHAAEDIGARRLQTILSILLEAELYNLPDSAIKTVKIDKKLVQQRLESIIQDQDLGKYIL